MSILPRSASCMTMRPEKVLDTEPISIMVSASAFFPAAASENPNPSDQAISSPSTRTMDMPVVFAACIFAAASARISSATASQPSFRTFCAPSGAAAIRAHNASGARRRGRNCVANDAMCDMISAVFVARACFI